MGFIVTWGSDTWLSSSEQRMSPGKDSARYGANPSPRQYAVAFALVYTLAALLLRQRSKAVGNIFAHCKMGE